MSFARHWNYFAFSHDPSTLNVVFLQLPLCKVAIVMSVCVFVSIDAPLVTTGNDFTQVPLFDMLMLSCDFVAVPVPTSIQWFLNFTQELVSDGSSIMIVSTDTSSTLMITNVMRNSTGNYTCMVSNLLGTGEAISMVRIQSKPLCSSTMCAIREFRVNFFADVPQYVLRT